jgi:DNA-binding transcriptional ArsR family regulator
MTSPALILEGAGGPPEMDAFDRLLWWLFAGSVGAQSRTTIVFALRVRPQNTQQLAEKLGLDYTTVRHHLSVLEKNRIVVTEGEKYGKVYFVTEVMDSHWDSLESILEKTRLTWRRGGR